MKRETGDALVHNPKHGDVLHGMATTQRSCAQCGALCAEQNKVMCRLGAQVSQRDNKTSLCHKNPAGSAIREAGLHCSSPRKAEPRVKRTQGFV